jgi:hypothetical protein
MGVLAQIYVTKAEGKGAMIGIDDKTLPVLTESMLGFADWIWETGRRRRHCTSLLYECVDLRHPYYQLILDTKIIFYFNL